MLFDSWTDLVRVLVTGVAAYVGLVALLRVSGKRTLSKMNAFDFIVTVALGSILATTLLSRDVSLIEGLAAFAVLIGLQYAMTWTSVRWRPFNQLIKARPRLLAYRGELHPEAMRKERVTEEEIAAAVRDRGLPHVSAAHAVILETDGSLTVLRRDEKRGDEDEDGPVRYASLRHVRGLPDELADRIREDD